MDIVIERAEAGGPEPGTKGPVVRLGHLRTVARAGAVAFLGTLLACGAPARPGNPAPAPPTEAQAGTAAVIFGADTVRAEVARTEEARARGLMARDSVADGTGMLFVFQEPGVHGVWMKDTPAPLDAAFLDVEGVILDIIPLEPHDTTVHWPSGPILYVLEVPRGWFAAQGVQEGDRARIVIEGDP